MGWLGNRRIGDITQFLCGRHQPEKDVRERFVTRVRRYTKSYGVGMYLSFTLRTSVQASSRSSSSMREYIDIFTRTVSVRRRSSIGNDILCCRSERSPDRVPPVCSHSRHERHIKDVKIGLSKKRQVLTSRHRPRTILNNSSRYQNNSR